MSCTISLISGLLTLLQCNIVSGVSNPTLEERLNHLRAIKRGLCHGWFGWLGLVCLVWRPNLPGSGLAIVRPHAWWLKPPSTGRGSTIWILSGLGINQAAIPDGSDTIRCNCSAFSKPSLDRSPSSAHVFAACRPSPDFVKALIRAGQRLGPRGETQPFRRSRCDGLDADWAPETP